MFDRVLNTPLDTAYSLVISFLMSVVSLGLQSRTKYLEQNREI